MIAAAIEFFGVEWVGDGPVLAQLAPLLGSLFVAAAAAYAARLAANTANKRQLEQLEHDAERQREQLEHDTERQREVLEHDRVVRKLEHARDAVDVAVDLANETHKATTALLTSADLHEKRRDGLEARLADDEASQEDKKAVGDDLRKQAREFGDEVIECRNKVLATFSPSFSLSLRLGSIHAISRKYDALIRAWNEIITSVEFVPKRKRDESEKAASKAAAENARECYTALLAECENWLR